MPTSDGNFSSASSTVIPCAGAYFSMYERRRSVITGPGRTLFTCTPISHAYDRRTPWPSRTIAALTVATAAKPDLGTWAELPRREDHRTLGGLEGLPGMNREAAGPVQLERKTIVPLLVGHLQHIHLGHGAGDVHDRVDASRMSRESGPPSFSRAGWVRAGPGPSSSDSGTPPARTSAPVCLRQITTAARPTRCG